MSDWTQTVIGLSVLVIAIGVLTTKVALPFYRVIKQGEEVITEMLPVLRDATAALADTPDAFTILEQIIAQFRTDSGSSLRDVVNALTAAAEANRSSIATLIAEAAAFRMLAEGDRVQIARLIDALGRIDAKVDVAALHAALVAGDLAASGARADEHVDSPPGEAADAAAQTAKESEDSP